MFDIKIYAVTARTLVRHVLILVAGSWYEFCTETAKHSIVS